MKWEYILVVAVLLVLFAVDKKTARRLGFLIVLLIGIIIFVVRGLIGT